MKEKSKILSFYGTIAIESGIISYVFFILYIIMYVTIISINLVGMVCLVNLEFLVSPSLCDELKVGLGNPFCDELEEAWSVIPADAYLLPEKIYGKEVSGPDFDVNKHIDHPVIIARYDIDPVKINSWKEALIWKNAHNIRWRMIESTEDLINRNPEQYHSILLEKCAELKKFSQDAEQKGIKALDTFHINHPRAYFHPWTIASLCPNLPR